MQMGKVSCFQFLFDFENFYNGELKRRSFSSFDSIAMFEQKLDKKGRRNNDEGENSIFRLLTKKNFRDSRK